MSVKVLIGQKQYVCRKDTLISDFLLSNELLLAMPCGGGGKCGKCKIQAKGGLSQITAAEKRLLSDSELASGIRLACETRIVGECTLGIYQHSDADIVIDGIGDIGFSSPRYRECGLAIDIGTTTIAMKLFDNKQQLAAETSLNPQERFGADVISRISRSLGGGAEEIKSVTVSGINKMISSICSKANIVPCQIEHVVITGNTAMLYLITGECPDSLSHLPFAASRLFGEYVKAEDIGLILPGQVPVYLTRCLAAFIGGDISSAIIASGMLENSESSLLVDVGTNGEMALWHDGQLICCSTAAGPAFEGAEISCGINGERGAIDKIWTEKENVFAFSVIGGGIPRGICGSGIIDAVSVLLQEGFIDSSGAFDIDLLNHKDRLLMVNEMPACLITEGIYVTQKDVRMVQLAKSAICSGIDTMLNKLNISPEVIKTLYLAGGFGNYLNISSAASIGLLPAGLEKKTKVIGNAALQGAAMTLTNSNITEGELLKDIPMTVLDLGADPEFMDNYIENMSF